MHQMGPTAFAEAKTQPGVEVTTRRAPRVPWSPTEDYLLMCMVKGKGAHVARLGDGALSHSPGPEAPPGATSRKLILRRVTISTLANRDLPRPVTSRAGKRARRSSRRSKNLPPLVDKAQK
ncbi:hypothetical protein E4U09_007280 [Claviceps aff. purpurea]|uniref:Uncharacterized protein n=1 Tax=Claviceps aff. purpurea TaxID=1967640 RepID=A0A9P7TZQ2_9HYPO|nr:hypothetical protein E4U09_007280 [Claviceps aff. purpurea]